MGASALLLAEGTMAQDDVTNLGIEEMVVTAQKREENLQAVPISISALSATDIERRGVQNAADLVSTIPNMGGFTSPGARATSRSTCAASAAAALQPVERSGCRIYIDGVILGKQVGSSLDVAELERVEVLRGPQGTLYGRNSTGGAVNFITKQALRRIRRQGQRHRGQRQPVGHASAAVDTPTLGTDGEGAGTLKAPSAQTRERDGLYGSDATVGQDFDDLDRQAYRVALRWEPNDAVTFDYAWDKSKLDENEHGQYSPVGLNAATPDPTIRVDRITRLNGYIGRIRPVYALAVVRWPGIQRPHLLALAELDNRHARRDARHQQRRGASESRAVAASEAGTNEIPKATA
jgi:iron complex outermembrane receptor protein